VFLRHLRLGDRAVDTVLLTIRACAEAQRIDRLTEAAVTAHNSPQPIDDGRTPRDQTVGVHRMAVGVEPRIMSAALPENLARSYCLGALPPHGCEQSTQCDQHIGDNKRNKD
jgi:hypothetical protein